MRSSGPREHSYRGFDKAKIVAVVFVAFIAAAGYVVYSFYVENQAQAQEILQKSQQIVSLEATVENQSATISDQASEISELDATVRDLSVQVGDLSGRLGIASQEISDLTPKIRNYYVVGVKGDGEGVVVPIEVKIVRGGGAVSANIDRVEFLSGTQDSIRAAAYVAGAYTDISTFDRDITISFVYSGDDIVTVDGGSAGGAIAIAIIATLLEKSPDTSVLMTGTISADGKIGPIGSVAAKAEAARNFGATTFLVPPGQAVDVAGINVVSVATIEDVVAVVL